MTGRFDEVETTDLSFCHSLHGKNGDLELITSQGGNLAWHSQRKQTGYQYLD
jgi:hypothetical protein